LKGLQAADAFSEDIDSTNTASNVIFAVDLPRSAAGLSVITPRTLDGSESTPEEQGCPLETTPVNVPTHCGAGAADSVASYSTTCASD
jgi:hypothetical protein